MIQKLRSVILPQMAEVEPEFRARFQSSVYQAGNREGVVVSLHPKILAGIATYWLERAQTPQQREREERALSVLLPLSQDSQR